MPRSSSELNDSIFKNIDKLEEDTDFDATSLILGFCYGVSFGVFLIIFLIKYI